MRGEWIKPATAGMAAVFVHGIFASHDTSWRDGGGGYWPQLLATQPELDSLGVYVFTYQTDFFSGAYRLGNAVDALKEHLRLDGVLACHSIVFVCHSMGGILVRKFLVERAQDFIDRGTSVGLFLIASPSLGSTYANWLGGLAVLLNHSQADALRFGQDNAWLRDLDKEFQNLKEAGRLRIRGKELVEDKFVVLRKWWRKPVVEEFAASRYFGEAFKVPGSDHFSIAAPPDRHAIQHRLLCEFIEQMNTSGARPGPYDTAELPGSPEAGPRPGSRGHTETLNPSPARPRWVGSVPQGATGRFFKGRERELASAARLLVSDDTRLVVVAAAGGMGKTALAFHLLRTLVRGDAAAPDSSAVDGVAVVDLRAKSGAPFQGMFFSCATLIGLAADWADAEWRREESRTGNLLSRFQGQGRHILFLDNVETVIDSRGRFTDNDVQHFVDRVLADDTHSLRILATSRRDVAVDASVLRACKHVHFSGGLSDEESLALLADLSQSPEDILARPPRSPAAEEVQKTIVRVTDGIPRALELAGSLVLRKAAIDFRNVEKLILGSDDIIARFFEENYRILPPAARAILEVLAVFGEPVSCPGIEIVVNELHDQVNVPDELDALIQCFLVRTDDEATAFALHPLDQAYLYARQLRDAPGEVQATHLMAARFFRADRGNLLDRRLGGTRKLLHSDIVSIWREFDHLLKAGGQDQIDAAAELVLDFGADLPFCGSASLCRRMVDAVAGRATSDRARLGIATSELCLRIVVGPMSEAGPFAEAAGRLARALQSPKAEAIVELRLGTAARYTEDIAGAIKHFEQAQALCAEAGDPDHELFVAADLSLSYSHIGDIASALRYGQLLLEHGTRDDDAATMFGGHDAVSLACLRAGRWHDAVAHCGAALEVADRRVHEGKAYVMNVLGIAEFALGLEEKAIATLLAAASAAESFQSLRARSVCLFNLALAYYLTGDGRRQGLDAALRAAPGLEQARLGQQAQSLISLLNQEPASAGSASLMFECARQAAANPDLFPPGILCTRAAALAKETGMDGLSREIQTWSDTYQATLKLPPAWLL